MTATACWPTRDQSLAEQERRLAAAKAGDSRSENGVCRAGTGPLEPRAIDDRTRQRIGRTRAQPWPRARRKLRPGSANANSRQHTPGSARPRWPPDRPSSTRVRTSSGSKAWRVAGSGRTAIAPRGSRVRTDRTEPGTPTIPVRQSGRRGSAQTSRTQGTDTGSGISRAGAAAEVSGTRAREPPPATGRIWSCAKARGTVGLAGFSATGRSCGQPGAARRGRAVRKRAAPSRCTGRRRRPSKPLSSAPI